MSHPHRSTARRPASLGASIAEAVESQHRLDGVVKVLAGPAGRLTAGPARRHVLLGQWLGHALHPLLTDLPIGCWASAWFLDVLPVPGGRRASQRLIGIGLAAAGPTALTGWAEWSRTTEAPDRRTGVVHAAASATAVVLYTGSWLARRRGRHGLGVVIGQLGAATIAASGFLGAHLAIGRKVGSSVSDHARRPARDR